MPESHSETTKPHISIEDLLAHAGGLEPLLEQRDRMAAALSDFVAALRLANEMLASRDERIRALEEAAKLIFDDDGLIWFDNTSGDRYYRISAAGSQAHIGGISTPATQALLALLTEEADDG